MESVGSLNNLTNVVELTHFSFSLTPQLLSFALFPQQTFLPLYDNHWVGDGGGVVNGVMKNVPDTQWSAVAWGWRLVVIPNMLYFCTLHRNLRLLLIHLTWHNEIPQDLTCVNQQVLHAHACVPFPSGSGFSLWIRITHLSTVCIVFRSRFTWLGPNHVPIISLFSFSTFSQRARFVP